MRVILDMFDVLYENRLMRNSGEINRFVNIIDGSLNNVTITDIPKLMRVFDDDTDHDEVMFSIIHIIESLYKINEFEGLKLFALSVPDTLVRGHRWVEIMHFRILNSLDVSSSYIEVLKRIDVNARDSIIHILHNIKLEDPDVFGDSVDRVIDGIKLDYILPGEGI